MRNVIPVVCLIMILLSIVIRLGTGLLNTAGDGIFPCQTLTATALGYNRYTDACWLEPGEDWECDPIDATVTAFAPWAHPATAPVAQWFGTVAELTTLIIVLCVSLPKEVEPSR